MYCQKSQSKLHKRMLEVGLENWKIALLLTLRCDKKKIEKFEHEYKNLLTPDLRGPSTLTWNCGLVLVTSLWKTKKNRNLDILYIVRKLKRC